MPSKYRLMNIFDKVYDMYIFYDDKDYVDINEINCDLDYSFVENMFFYFIDKILRYDDNTYKYVDNEYYNLVNYYFNIIRKLIIKAYYYLSDDNIVSDKIKNNLLYGANKISTILHDSIIEKNDVKTKIRKAD